MSNVHADTNFRITDPDSTVHCPAEREALCPGMCFSVGEGEKSSQVQGIAYLMVSTGRGPRNQTCQKLLNPFCTHFHL